MSLPFLYTDRAESVFALLFLFAEPDLKKERNGHHFDSTLREILSGAKLPAAAQTRVRFIYDRTRQEPLPLRDAILRVAADFRHEREILIWVLRILVRLLSDEGMFCEQDKQRLKEAMLIFDLSSYEYSSLEESEREMLYFCFYGDAAHSLAANDELILHYQTLGCSRESKDDEIRRSYRKLVMQFHPDRAAVAEVHGESVKPCRFRFEQVQNAYHAICLHRGIKV